MKQHIIAPSDALTTTMTGSIPVNVGFPGFNTNLATAIAEPRIAKRQTNCINLKKTTV